MASIRSWCTSSNLLCLNPTALHQDELLAWSWLISVMELIIVLFVLGHVTGSFFYMFAHPAWQVSALYYDYILLIGDLGITGRHA